MYSHPAQQQPKRMEIPSQILSKGLKGSQKAAIFSFER
jgi:hypothetical protein